MTVNVQFGDIQELEAVFRANVLFKFSGSEDADVFLGSPVMAEALNRMLDERKAGGTCTQFQRPNVMSTLLRRMRFVIRGGLQ
jgi:hypothetical protein